MKRRLFTQIPLLGTATMFVGSVGAEEAWPAKPVRIFVGFPPGQSSDISARMLAEQLQKITGQAFIVENRPGAGATIGAAATAGSPKDGYTVAFTSTGPLAIAPHLYKSLNYDPRKDLTVASTVAQAPLILVVSASSSFKSLEDIVAAGRTANTINYGTGGNGVTNHLATKMFETATGTSFTHVPYKGTAPALTDLMSGQIQFTFESPAPLLPLIRDGRLRALATTGGSRYTELPTVPSVAESFRGFEAVSWTAFAFPAGTPTPIVEKLNAVTKRILEDPEFAKRMRATGVEPFFKGSSEACDQFAGAEYAKWRDVIRKGNISIE